MDGQGDLSLHWRTCQFLSFADTVVPRYNDHLYSGNFDFRQNFFENRSFLIKIYYIIMEFTLSDTDGDSQRRNAFLYTFFIHLNDIRNIQFFLSAKFSSFKLQKKTSNFFLSAKFSTCRKPLHSLSQLIGR